jgi:hypothetical protein
MPFKKGDPIWVMAGGRRMIGTIMLASPNQKSLFVEFDGALLMKGGMLPGQAPLLLAEDGSHYFPLMDDTTHVTVEPRET